METLAWIGFSQSLFAALLVGTKTESSISDKLLTGWLCLLAIEFFTCALDYNIFTYPLLSNSFLLFNPAFFLYIKSLTDRSYRLRWIQLLHLVPYVMFELSAYILKEPHSLDSFIQNGPNLLFRIVFATVSSLSWILYNIASLKLVRKHQLLLKNEFSSIGKSISLGWILFVVIFYLSFCMIALGMGVFAITVHTHLLLPNTFVYATLLLLAYILGYYGLMQKDIYSRMANEEPEVKYKKSLLSAEVKSKLEKKIQDYFRTQQPYLNSELNMDMLSDHLKTPKYQLTEVLNTNIGKNFFQFVNEYRVEAVKKILSDPKNPYSIEAVGYECGFNSKSSFYTVFKRITGQTPHEFKKKQIQKEAS